MRDTNFRKTVSAGLACMAMLIAALLPVWPAMAQNAYSAAAVVNDTLITNYDVEQRMRLLRLLGQNPPDPRSAALETLIDDKLREQAARAQGIQLTDERITEALNEFGRQRNMTGSQLVSRLGKQGVTRQAVVDLVANQVAYRDAMRARFLSRATPTETELESAALRAPGTANMSVLLAEIVLPYAERGPLKTEELAEQLYNSLSGGSSFAAAARKYSRANSARKGGKVGWLKLDTVPPQIASQLAILQDGQVTRPIPIPQGVAILQLIESKVESTDDTSNAVTVTLGRVIIPLGVNASETDVIAAQAEAERLRSSVRACAQIEERKAEFGTGTGVMGPVTIDKLQSNEQAAVRRLSIGQSSSPVRVTEGMAVLILCDRSGVQDLAVLEQVRTQVINERMASYANGYLTELRRDAVIEYR